MTARIPAAFGLSTGGWSGGWEWHVAWSGVGRRRNRRLGISTVHLFRAGRGKFAKASDRQCLATGNHHQGGCPGGVQSGRRTGEWFWRRVDQVLVGREPGGPAEWSTRTSGSFGLQTVRSTARCSSPTTGARPTSGPRPLRRFIDEPLTRAPTRTTSSISLGGPRRRALKGDLSARPSRSSHITNGRGGHLPTHRTTSTSSSPRWAAPWATSRSSVPFEAIRQFRLDIGRIAKPYFHVTPSRSSKAVRRAEDQAHPAPVTELRSRGIQPDAIVCRSEAAIGDDQAQDLQPLRRRWRRWW